MHRLGPQNKQMSCDSKVRIATRIHGLIKMKGVSNGPMIDQLLRTYASPAQHGQTSIGKLLGFHALKGIVFCRLQSQRIKPKVARIIIVPQSPECIS